MTPCGLRAYQARRTRSNLRRAVQEGILASTINVAAYSDALVVLGTAGIVVPIVSRLGFSPVLGYLGAGALLGRWAWAR